MLFRQVVLYALLVGAACGLLLTTVQAWQVVPIIKSAERFEQEADDVAEAPAHVHANTAAGHSHEAHEHDADAWKPAEGVQRTGFTLLANVLIATGLALVLLPAMVASRKNGTAGGSGWRHGLVWGAAGYAVFFLAPTLGLPPEIPGAAAAPLDARQGWWLLTVLCTAAGLAGAAFGKSPWRWMALALLLVPHLVGAPQPAVEPFTGQSPEVAAELADLAHRFIGATSVANAVLWLALGLGSAWAVKRVVAHSATSAMSSAALTHRS